MIGRSTAAARSYLEVLLIAVLLATFARSFLLQAFKIPSSSMADNLRVGDQVLVNRFVFRGTSASPSAFEALLPMRPVRRGDVVVFAFPRDSRRTFVKRCVALGGDTIELVDKGLFVNGVEVEDGAYAVHRDARVFRNSAFLEERYRYRDNFGPYLVPDGQLFVLGDNRDHSQDSRIWGPVPRASIKGRAFLVYWSTWQEPGSADTSRGRIGQTFDRLVRGVRAIRWRQSPRWVR